MGETRVDLHHLLEDIRDAYPGSLEETILAEIVANSLDSGASQIVISADPTAGALTVSDDGKGMTRAALRRYHDLASTSKRRGRTIGFAGVGIKLAGGLASGTGAVAEAGGATEADGATEAGARPESGEATEAGAANPGSFEAPDDPALSPSPWP